MSDNLIVFIHNLITIPIHKQYIRFYKKIHYLIVERDFVL